MRHRPTVHRPRWRRRTAFAASVPLTAACLIGSSGCQQLHVPKPPSFEVETQPWRFGRTEGTLLTTPHYNIHTTVEDEDLHVLVPRLLETAHQHYVRVLPVDEPVATRSDVYVFRTRNQWEQFTRQFSPARADTYLRIRSGGYAEPRGTVVYCLRRRYTTLAVIAHECLHMYVFRNFPRRSVPPWLNEGLACYCEGHEWHDQTPVFTPGQNRFRMNSVRRALARGTLFKLEEMLGTNVGKIVRFSPKRVAVYYAQAWSMVAFLMASPTYRDPFAKLRRELGTEQMRLAINGYLVANPTSGGRPMSRGEALFRCYISDDLERFNAEYGVWLRKLTQPEERSWWQMGLGSRVRGSGFGVWDTPGSAVVDEGAGRDTSRPSMPYSSDRRRPSCGADGLG